MIKYIPLRTAALFLLAGILLSCTNTRQEEVSENYLIMLSMDGFRWDYTDKTETPNFDRIASEGVKAESLKPCFPTKTFPNHYSIATGLYPDHHGIVQNSFYDPEMDAYYAIRDRQAVENGEFYGGEPIWNTAEKQGVKAGCFFWVGSEADVQGMYASYTKKYNHDLPFSQRVDSVVAWLELPEEKRPRLIMWYMHEPDSKGHYYGPENPGLMPTITTLDSLLGVFLDHLEELPIYEDINIIVTSDHGMGQTSNERVVYLDDYIEEEWFSTIQGYNPTYLFKVKEEHRENAFNALKEIENVSVWKHGEVPERLHYGTNPRTLDFILVADSSWSVGWRKDEGRFDGGAHGYDNSNKDMHAMFYAMGPDFRENYIHPTFENIDIYPLIAEILGLQPAEVDGKLENVKEMLVNEQ